MKQVSDVNDLWDSLSSSVLPETDSRRNGDPDVHLTIPRFDVADPELSIVIPALNEVLTIGPFVDWCHEGLRQANVRGEVLIVDSSTDGTAEIAISRGARVLKTPKRGLGRAYIDALPFIRGKYVLMGDADCTYDFRNIEPFMESLRSGHEYVMGSRFRGSIEPGSMPLHHQYFGSPLTTWILNFLCASRFSDIHCGMRGITRTALMRMNIQSQAWEYASEMVLKSVRMNLRTAEVPVRFLKDQEGRFSHHKRTGWFSPWAVGWTSLKTMFIYRADSFLFGPGLLLLCAGLLLTLPLALGPVTLGPIQLDLNGMLIGLILAVLGLYGVFMAAIARVFLDYTGAATERLLGIFSYTRSVAGSVGAGIAGVALAFPFVLQYFRPDHTLLNDTQSLSHLAVAGLLFLVAGFMTFAFTLALHASTIIVKRK